MAHRGVLDPIILCYTIPYYIILSYIIIIIIIIIIGSSSSSSSSSIIVIIIIIIITKNVSEACWIHTHFGPKGPFIKDPRFEYCSMIMIVCVYIYIYILVFIYIYIYTYGLHLSITYVRILETVYNAIRCISIAPRQGPGRGVDAHLRLRLGWFWTSEGLARAWY